MIQDKEVTEIAQQIQSNLDNNANTAASAAPKNATAGEIPLNKPTTSDNSDDTIYIDRDGNLRATSEEPVIS